MKMSKSFVVNDEYVSKLEKRTKISLTQKQVKKLAKLKKQLEKNDYINDILDALVTAVYNLKEIKGKDFGFDVNEFYKQIVDLKNAHRKDLEDVAEQYLFLVTEYFYKLCK